MVSYLKINLKTNFVFGLALFDCRLRLLEYFSESFSDFFWVSLGVRTCELFLCFVAIVSVRGLLC